MTPLTLILGTWTAFAVQISTDQPSLASIARDYQIHVDLTPSLAVKTSWGVVEGRAADRKNVARYTPLFVREFTLLPPSLIAKAKLKRVVFCEELSFGGQRRNAVPDWEHDTLYLEVSRGSRHPRYLAAVIHHEFFHMVDYHDDGSVYKDDAWAALNPKDFKYGDGGKNWQKEGSSTTALTDKFPGFLTHYGTTGVEEDKAELFAHLIVHSNYVKTRAASDAVLQAKIERLKANLKAFCPEVNDEWWKKVEKVERPVGD